VVTSRQLLEIYRLENGTSLHGGLLFLPVRGVQFGRGNTSPGSIVQLAKRNDAATSSTSTVMPFASMPASSPASTTVRGFLIARNNIHPDAVLD
jgi:hypothetical protein